MKKTQFGRSMIEMLAVLAMVGLLSIVAFWAYEMAMARHRASEVISQTNALALGVEEQLEMDVEDVDVTSYIPEGSAFLTIAGYEAYFEESDATTAFEITLEDVDKKVCERLVNAGWSEPYAILINGSTEGACVENNEITAAYNNTLDNVNPCAQMTCPGSTVCSLGECVCPSGQDLCNVNTGVCCAENQVCSTGGDVPGTCVRNKNTCTVNADCAEVEECAGITCYCHLNGYLTSGECRPLDAGVSLPTARADFAPLLSWKAGKFLRSTSNMNYYAATNWCKAHGKRMVSLSDFHIDLSMWNYPIASGTGDGTKKTTACHDGYDDRPCNLPQTNFLKTALNSANFWTTDDYTVAGFGWYVDFISAGIRIRVYQMRRNEINKALCK